MFHSSKISHHFQGLVLDRMVVWVAERIEFPKGHRWDLSLDPMQLAKSSAEEQRQNFLRKESYPIEQPQIMNLNFLQQ